MSDQPMWILCPVCGGEGEIDGLVIGDETVRERCETCEGTGLVLEETDS